MLTNQKKQQICESLKKLVSSHQEFGHQIENATSELIKTLRLEQPEHRKSSDRPVVDSSTFTVSWRGRTCRLGNTLLFWLLHRLSLSTNCYIAHVELLDDVWHGSRESSTIRGVVKRLRDQLISAGMQSLADSIDGSVSGYYGLIIV